MGEEKKKEEGSKEKEEKKEEEKKKEEEEVQEIVLKVDMHCEACARKVARALKGFQGVEKVTADCKASKVVVRGKGADAVKVCERIQKKSGRKVELISPLPENAPPPPPPPPPPAEDTKEPVGVKKEEPPAVITVVLNVQMHCEACAQVLQKRIRKVKGVESVTTDVANNQVIVKGAVDPEKLVSDVYKRTRKQASIVKDEKKEEGEKKDDVEKKEVKEEEKKESQEAGSQGDLDDTKTTEMKKIEYWRQRYNLENAYPPQIFSDENPHACTLM